MPKTITFDNPYIGEDDFEGTITVRKRWSYVIIDAYKHRNEGVHRYDTEREAVAMAFAENDIFPGDVIETTYVWEPVT